MAVHDQLIEIHSAREIAPVPDNLMFTSALFMADKCVNSLSRYAVDPDLDVCFISVF